MPKAATLTKCDDGSFTGELRTLFNSANIRIVPNASKSTENAPDFRVTDSFGDEWGALWTKRNRQTQEPFTIGSVCTPEIGEARVKLVTGDGDDASLFWLRERD